MTFDVELPAHETLTQQVVRQFTNRILTRALPPGTALPPEKELARQLGVSRIVVRESVRILATLGLVSVRHGVGTFVNGADTWQLEQPLTLMLRADRQSLLDWLEMRMVIETGLARLAAQRASREHCAAIAATIARMRTHATDLERGIEADLAFHEAVARAAGNAFGVALMRPLLRPIRQHLLVVIQVPHALESAADSHERILAAIAQGDDVQAASAMQQHLVGTIKEIEALYRHQTMPMVEVAGSD